MQQKLVLFSVFSGNIVNMYSLLITVKHQTTSKTLYMIKIQRTKFIPFYFTNGFGITVMTL